MLSIGLSTPFIISGFLSAMLISYKFNGGNGDYESFVVSMFFSSEITFLMLLILTSFQKEHYESFKISISLLLFIEFFMVYFIGRLKESRKFKK